MAIYFDIETAPLESQKLNALMPVFKARANIKDPEKIEADIREKIAEFIANAALDASTGRVVAFGWAVDGGDVKGIAYPDAKDEGDILKFAWDTFTDERGVIIQDIIGHNSNKFDIPFLVRRSRIVGVDVPPTVLTWSRGRMYLDQHFKDTMDAWACGTTDKIKLDTLAKCLGVGAKNGDGANFFETLKSAPRKALEYLKNDVELTRACALRLGMAKWM